MPDRNFGQLAAGLNEAFFGSLFQDRQAEQARKDQDLARQLAAYHALLEHPDTQQSDIPDIMDASAKLLKKEKEFKPITDHMRQAMKRQIPYGQEEERQISTPQIHYQLPTADTAAMHVDPRVPTGAQVDPNYYVRPLPDGAAPGPMAERPRSGAEMGLYGDGANATITPTSFKTEDVVPIVPPDPTTVHMQPTRAYGELSVGEAEDYRKGQFYMQQQKAVLDRQAQLAEAAGDRAAERDVQRQKDELARIERRAEEQRKTQTAMFEGKIKILPLVEQAKARARVSQIAASLPAGLSPEDRDRQARELAMGEVQVAVAQKKQQIEASKAQMARLGVLNAKDAEQIRIIKGKGTGLADGLSASAAREFNVRTGSLRAQLASKMRQLEAAKKEAAGAPSFDEQNAIDLMEAEQGALIEQINKVRDGMLSRQDAARVPSASGNAASRTTAPTSAGTFDMKGWSQSHPNATDAERSAVRAKAKARNLTVAE